jgi:hypothetical protein
MSRIRIKQIEQTELSNFVTSVWSGTINQFQTDLGNALNLGSGASGGVVILSGKIDTLSGLYITLQNQFTGLTFQFDLLSGQFSDIQSQFAEITGDIAVLQSDISGINTQLSSLDADVIFALSGLEDLEFKFDILSGNLNTFSGGLDYLHEYVGPVVGARFNNTGVLSGVSVSDVLDFIAGSGEGDMLYRGAFDWERLPAGPSGYHLKTNGSSAPPEWVSTTQGTKTLFVFAPRDNEPPTSNFATLDTRNSHPVLDFDTTTQETAIFRGKIPEGTILTDGLTVYVQWAVTSATTGTVGWDVAFERIVAGGVDIDSDSFDTAQTITAATVPGTNGVTSVTSVNFSGAELPVGFTAGDMFRIRIRRDVSNDTATGDAELLQVEIRLQ